MKHSKKEEIRSSGFFRPFENLKSLLDSNSFPLAPCPEEILFPRIDIDLEPDDPEYEQILFNKAMADVIPLSKGKYAEEDAENHLPNPFFKPGKTEHVFDDDTEEETLSRLRHLVEKGKGFVLADTSEYIEGRGYCDNPEITERLHRGDFSIQAYTDLHGLNAENAEVVFDEFIKDAIMTGKRAVLVVHGRGLSSPLRPVLKTKVQDWLVRGPWRKWVIAFSSARACDGGTGATYVLLRQRPVTKRFRKRRKASRY
jgi:DNA-nicking Smr family endonuclease